ncbi:GIY-YIG nuclease family protein [Kordiimonas marina]|uniref:GIY-YIG nuclease family protein n=1 Tax=Kordiimonas marina TaxID=2872312 RepID=UPI001FF4FBAD|nr:GIY-YIG nuclease family protein [Kordiimonas marina]MCJ9429141.1 GIY-YIG nuclease family protein [Kordiimonas marina]
MTYHVYMLASKPGGTLYIGVTNDIARRMEEHRTGQGSAFVKQYGVTRLVYLEAHEDVRIALQREKTLKDWNRQWKIDLIERGNPDWDDLFDRLNV